MNRLCAEVCTHPYISMLVQCTMAGQRLHMMLEQHVCSLTTGMYILLARQLTQLHAYLLNLHYRG